MYKIYFIYYTHILLCVPLVKRFNSGVYMHTWQWGFLKASKVKKFEWLLCDFYMTPTQDEPDTTQHEQSMLVKEQA